jgi:hypothetical protein
MVRGSIRIGEILEIRNEFALGPLGAQEFFLLGDLCLYGQGALGCEVPCSLLAAEDAALGAQSPVPVRAGEPSVQGEFDAFAAKGLP